MPPAAIPRAPSAPPKRRSAKFRRSKAPGPANSTWRPETARLFEQAEKLADKAGDSFVTAERLLLALAMASGSPSADALKQAGITAQSLNAAINDVRKGRTAEVGLGGRQL